MKTLIFVFIITAQSFAQITVQTINKNGLPSTKTYPPGVIVTSIIKGDSTLATFTLDINENVRVIVKFKELPLSHIMGLGKKQNYSAISSLAAKIDNEHSQFKNDLIKIENDNNKKYRSLNKPASTQIHFEYKTALNGMAITTKRWVVEEIKKLPYVKSVYKDKEVKAYDNISNHVIGADSVWIKLGLTGKNIKIGILDTGIDYLHQDLGGGIGPGFKVLGGFDLINNDNDPMDDNGHGTHVAGIAAANGTSLKGVAPDANLYAFKVLDNTGSGLTSIVIAGIERALDPDQDTNTNDAVNIISMSLGGPGDPDDPVSQAVDNATSAGVISIIAAGNSGPLYQTIGSPGNSRTALTVGATDNNDVIADFSSRGPSNNIFGIKPDILAPGVGINSTKMGGGYISYNGTSMATPHVSGAAALILELHPNWTPAMIKSVLMVTAKDIGKDIWTQGNGRLDVYSAAKANTFISPASLSFGFVDLSQSVFTVIDTIKIYNFSSIQKSYSFSLSSNLPTGFNITFDPQSIVVNPNEIKSITVSAIVNNSILPFANIDPPAYTGQVIAMSSLDTLKIPFALLKSPILKINFDEEPWVVFIHNRKDKYYFKAYPGTQMSILLPQDTYDLNISYPDVQTHIFIEDININSLSIIDIKKNEAKNKIKLQTLDEKGDSVFVNVGDEIFIHKASKLGTFITGGFSTEKNFSNFSNNYLWEWKANTLGSQPLEKFYSFNGYLDQGLNSGITQTNNPYNFKHITYNYNLDPGDSAVFPIFARTNFNDWGIFKTFTFFPEAPPLTPPFVQDVYLTPIPYPDFGKVSIFLGLYDISMIYQYEGSPFHIQQSALLLETPPIIATNKDTAEIWFLGDSSAFDKFIGTEFKAKYGPPHWFGKLQNTESQIILKDARGTSITRLFYYPLNDWTPLPDLRFQLYQNASIIDSGKIFDKAGLTMLVPPDKYTLRISSDHYYIQRKKGTATVQLTFDTRLADKNPPVLTSLKIFTNNNITDIIKPAESGSVSFSIEDESGLSSVNLYYQLQGFAAWNILTVNKNLNTYTSDLPSNIAIGIVSLKISATDLSGNILEYKVDPAFFFGEFSILGSPLLISPENNIALPDSVENIKFIWTSVELAETYTIQVSNSKSFDSLIVSVSDLVDTNYTYPKDLLNGTLYWRVIAKSQTAIGNWSETFAITTITDINLVENIIPEEFVLHQNYPNPFNPTTSIRYAIPEQSFVTLKIYNVLGQEIKTLVDKVLNIGVYEVKFNAGNLASGVYFYRIIAHSTDTKKDFIEAKKLILLR
ncbi:MAG: S8 family serine peptidase [Bacteroidetes bacterium]|nr:S8 family serine peptidase [Bacteroidota bacterium]